jgi:anti-sigma B factor antagonist
VGLLQMSVAAGETGPVLMLAGEADLTNAAALSDALAAQMPGARRLTVDLSRLRFADSAAVRALVLAGRALKDRGGSLELVRPQPAVARALGLLGVDQMLTVRDSSGTGAEPEHALPVSLLTRRA